MKEIKLEHFSGNPLFEVIFKLPNVLEERMILLEDAYSVEIITPKEPVYKFSKTVTKSPGIEFIIKFNSIDIYNYLEEWYNIYYAGLSYRNDLIGEIMINRFDKKGLLFCQDKFYSTIITSLKFGEIMEVMFVADYYSSDYISDCLNDATTPVIGYHLSDIKKGVLGELSKIEEELQELKDAEQQKSKIMIMVELSDLYGALEEYCIKKGITIEDLKIFSNITKRAFKNGRR